MSILQRNYEVVYVTMKVRVVAKRSFVWVEDVIDGIGMLFFFVAVEVNNIDVDTPVDVGPVTGVENTNEKVMKLAMMMVTMMLCSLFFIIFVIC